MEKQYAIMYKWAQQCFRFRKCFLCVLFLIYILMPCATKNAINVIMLTRKLSTLPCISRIPDMVWQRIHSNLSDFHKNSQPYLESQGRLMWWQCPDRCKPHRCKCQRLSGWCRGLWERQCCCRRRSCCDACPQSTHAVPSAWWL